MRPRGVQETALTPAARGPPAARSGLEPCHAGVTAPRYARPIGRGHHAVWRRRSERQARDEGDARTRHLSAPCLSQQGREWLAVGRAGGRPTGTGEPPLHRPGGAARLPRDGATGRRAVRVTNGHDAGDGRSGACRYGSGDDGGRVAGPGRKGRARQSGAGTRPQESATRRAAGAPDRTGPRTKGGGAAGGQGRATVTPGAAHETGPPAGARVVATRTDDMA